MVNALPKLALLGVNVDDCLYIYPNEALDVQSYVEC
jgi:hypothetical protein